MIVRTLSLGALSLMLAACGAKGSAGGTGVASIGRTSTTITRAVPAGGAGNDSAFAYAKCMRSKGIEIPDPEPGGGAVKLDSPAPGSGGIDPADPKFQEAEKACTKELGANAPSDAAPTVGQEAGDQSFAFSKCMRENGVDLPDPTGGPRTEKPAGEAVAPDSPMFQEAAKKCGLVLGGGGGDGEHGGKP